ncbi:MAG TPA: histidine phosphatase family protein [Blastocatellia bacterium]
MTVFLLIRHALNNYIGEAIAGWTPDVHLNDAGLAQAERLSERLAQAPIAAIYSSPLERARETAAPLAARLGLEVHIHDAFGEIRYGEWSGKSLAELAEDCRWRRFNSIRSLTRAPGGETMIEVQARAAAGLEELRELHPREMVAVFSHGDVIKAAIAYLAGIPIDFYYRFEISPASVSVVTIDDHGPRLLRVNDAGEPVV